jgi:hypothetical protein
MKTTTPEDPIKRSQLRVLQYQNIDGSFELTFSGLFLLMAVFFYFMFRVALPNSLLSNLMPLVLCSVFIGGGYLIDRLVQKLRERYTYPRTGYIAYSRQTKPLRPATRLMIWVGIPLLTVLLLAILFLNRSKFPVSDNPDYSLFIMPGFSGLLFSGLYAIMAWKLALPRFYLIAAASLLVGAGLLASGLPTYLGIAALFGALSLILLISGGLTLWHYLRSTRPPEGTPAKEKGESHEK